MKIQATIPCHKQPVALPAPEKPGAIRMIDRQCKECKHWWRADITFLRAKKDGTMMHAVEWIHIG